MNNRGVLYLIPATLGDTDINTSIPDFTKDIINEIDEFIVENERTARRYLKKLGIKKPLNDLVLHLLNQHTKPEEITTYLDPIEKGKNIGVISDAGCPAVADPGAEIVRLAHGKNIRVVPLVGPSSILLALMASGFNGQHFVFHGYLPKERSARIEKLRELERNVKRKNQTQMFMETPYRNLHLFEDIIKTCQNVRLCIAADITLPSEFIKTKSIKEWRGKLPDINKRPAIFLIYK
ncbi:SAM-dependent methyltransferase [bacterium AH-315-M05]|nr:SAM-dependent methyltransferase [bacterium AH-315-M05]